MRRLPEVVDGVQQAGGGVDDRGAGDPGRVDIAARQGAARNGLAEMLRPHAAAGGCVEGVDRVVLGGDEHARTGDEDLRVDLAVEWSDSQSSVVVAGR